MAQGVADAVGATKRQVQFWSDHGVLEFLPGSGGARGNQRLYRRTELPFAAMARFLAASGLRIETIKMSVLGARVWPYHPTHSEHKPPWYQRALRGETETYMLVTMRLIEDYEYNNFRWVGRKDLMKSLKASQATTVINVQRVLSPYVE